MTTVDTLELADRFFAAVETGDVDVLRELYHPDAEIWHNTDGVAQRRDDNLATLAWMRRHLPDLHYTAIRRAATTDGFVQQHVLVATNRAGRRVEVPACIVTKIGDDGRITRLDEYLDSAAVAAILEK
jgi:ketosteroid isomerase-like protein